MPMQMYKAVLRSNQTANLVSAYTLAEDEEVARWIFKRRYQRDYSLDSLEMLERKDNDTERVLMHSHDNEEQTKE
jgi:uncharacterized membrane protein